VTAKASSRFEDEEARVYPRVRGVAAADVIGGAGGAKVAMSAAGLLAQRPRWAALGMACPSPVKADM
jgi:hypothetical protein